MRIQSEPPTRTATAALPLQGPACYLLEIPAHTELSCNVASAAGGRTWQETLDKTQIATGRKVLGAGHERWPPGHSHFTGSSSMKPQAAAASTFCIISYNITEGMQSITAAGAIPALVQQRQCGAARPAAGAPCNVSGPGCTLESGKAIKFAGGILPVVYLHLTAEAHKLTQRPRALATSQTTLYNVRRRAVTPRNPAPVPDFRRALQLSHHGIASHA